MVVGFYKVGSGMPSMSWPESVDEALCFGWIDGVRKRIDDIAYQIRFTPRRSGSTWSAVNIAKAEALIAQGLMCAGGLAAYAARTEHKSRIYSYERDDPARLNADEESRLRGNAAAWHYFDTSPPGYRKTILHWLADAKRPDTRERRLTRLIDACARSERLR